MSENIKEIHLELKSKEELIESITRLITDKFLLTKEKQKLEQKNKSLKGSCKVLGQKNNNQRKELISLQLKNNHLKQQCDNLLKIVGDYNSRLNKATKELQELIDKVNNKTIIGLNEFIPKLEVIQDELVGDKE